MTDIRKELLEQMGVDPGGFMDQVIGLAKCARELVDAYPSWRDDPSDEDILNWICLRAASDKILGDRGEH